MREPRPRRPATWKGFALAAWVLAMAAGAARAQTSSESSVGYVDGAIPYNQFRLRFEASYDYPFPDRGEFFYSHSRMKPGESAELKADAQELAAYGEITLDPRFSVFAEVPLRAINPTLDPNATGLGDASAGFKYAFFSDEDYTATFQLRGYAPSGNKMLHLGSGHASVEPALLGYARLTDEGLVGEGELRLFVPIGGDRHYDSYVVRYGVGFSHPVWERPGLVVVPVAEFVGWTFLDGHKAVNLPDGVGTIVGAGGDTIVNVKLGVRLRTDYGDLYVGYGHAVSGTPFYKDIVRVEYRIRW
jgi:hypothetical protein